MMGKHACYVNVSLFTQHVQIYDSSLVRLVQEVLTSRGPTVSPERDVPGIRSKPNRLRAVLS